MASATVIIEAQPPHLGQFVAIQSLLKTYDTVTVCIIDKPILMATNKAVTILTAAFSDYSEVGLAVSDLNFLAIGTLPKQLQADMIFVSDKHIFTHLNSLGYKVEFLPHVQGYNDLFIRVAYRQGLAKDYLARFTQV